MWRLSYLLVCVLLAANIQFGWTRCANDCSCHGTCTDENECICDTGFDVVADCSQSKFYAYISSSVALPLILSCEPAYLHSCTPALLHSSS
jgi:hypothetical protein